MNTVNDKVVVILGASSGIGEATIRPPADKGAKLVIASRREEKLRELADSIERCTIAYKTADVASYEEVKKQSESARQAELDFRKTIDSLTAEDIATAVAYAIETPDACE